MVLESQKVKNGFGNKDEDFSWRRHSRSLLSGYSGEAGLPLAASFTRLGYLFHPSTGNGRVREMPP